MRMGSAALLVGILLTFAASQAVFATQHVVGDSAGWSKAADYVAWAANKPFTVGDTLMFNYEREDLVYEVTEDDYKSCTIGKPKHIYHGHGQTIVPLDKAGARYFLSPTFGHCTNGMKLAININPLTTSGTTTGLTIMSKQTQLPPDLPSLTCPGGGGLSPPFNPGGGGDAHSPPNPYGPNRGGATSMGKIDIFTVGFFSVLVLSVLFMA